MNPTRPQPRGAKDAPQSNAKPTTGAAARPVQTPVVPAAFRPPAKPASAQAEKTAAATSPPRRPVVPAPFAPQPASPLHPSIQRAKKRGAAGGKSGLSYTSVGSEYTQEEIAAAMRAAGLKGVKGHKRGNAGSGESGQTKKENQMVVEQLRATRTAVKENKKACRAFHGNDDNIGKLCPTCGDYVD